MAKNTNQFKSGQESKPTREKPGKPEKSKIRVPAMLTDGRFARIMGFFLILLTAFLLLAFTSYLLSWRLDSNILDNNDASFIVDSSISVQNWTGKIGAWMAHLFIKRGIGIAAYFILLLMFLAGFRLTTGVRLLPFSKTLQYSLIGMLWISVTLGFALRNDPELLMLGGIFGYQASDWLIGMVGPPGTVLILIFVLASFLVIINLIPFLRKKKEEPLPGEEELQAATAGNVPREDVYNTHEFAVSQQPETRRPVPVTDEDDFPQAPVRDTADKGIELTIEKTPHEDPGNQKGTVRGSLDTPYDPTLDLPDYRYPTLDLLADYPSETIPVAKEELEQNKDRIVETLNNYAIRIDKIKATIGPAVTLYEIIPAPGVRISRIKNLEDDIALSLSAMGIRIIAPIPGKGTIGIEVPNMKPEIVSIKSLLSSEKFRNSTFELPFALGKTISNESFIADLTKMPHILMAGATGQGKSVGLNAILLSLLYKKHPSQIKFVMIDPKKVELTLFSKIERHFLARLPDSEEAIVTDTRKVVRTLNSLGMEMDHRYELLKDAQVRNIKEYNTKFIARRLNPLEGHQFLPYIVVVVDEFADLIMTAGREIENPLTRLAQLARATGIHLVIATQRPSVNIITGTIKANFPARFAYRVISKVDSRTILDSSGADQLVGKGDMLLSTGSDLIRLQCAFVDTPEVDRVTEFIGSQRGYPDAFNLPEYYDESDELEKGDFDPNARDELFEDAARIIVQHQQGSTSLLQRKLKLGYNRAGRIIDQLEAARIVGPFEGSKAREVLIANEMALEQFLKDLYSK
ncbi:MAG: DNA translocase FtsK [Bacteroidales bacterium]|nr:DNA translocase FtsK [Bacteroidales bacterium]